MHAQRKPFVSSTHAGCQADAEAMANWELQRAARDSRQLSAANSEQFRREVAGNVIRYLPLPPAPTLPRPGEDGDPSAMSDHAFNVGLFLLGFAALLVFLARMLGLL